MTLRPHVRCPSLSREVSSCWSLSWIAAVVACLAYGVATVLQSVGARRAATATGVGGVVGIVTQVPYLAGSRAGRRRVPRQRRRPAGAAAVPGRGDRRGQRRRDGGHRRPAGREARWQGLGRSRCPRARPGAARASVPPPESATDTGSAVTIAILVGGCGSAGPRPGRLQADGPHSVVLCRGGRRARLQRRRRRRPGDGLGPDRPRPAGEPAALGHRRVRRARGRLLRRRPAARQGDRGRRRSPS